MAIFALSTSIAIGAKPTNLLPNRHKENFIMNAIILIIFIFLITLISSSAIKRKNLEIYHQKNNASFVAEVEEFAKWAELVFREYCGIVGANFALSELKPNTEFYYSNAGLVMPKLTIKRRNCLGRTFRETFGKCQDLDAIEVLRVRYSLPHTDDLQLDIATRKKFRTWGGGSIKSDYYKSLYHIIYLNVYLALQSRQFNIGQSGIKEDEIVEHQLIQKALIPYPWLSGDFYRY